ncbi:MAG: binding-protein-dependent transport system inner rane component [Thermomicrobiales bacterium]|jgi:peptide/nickel transport system permease protein|nr:binding-protein-dependent transport system inner rane component [Thermomicrobiales bacterium]
MSSPARVGLERLDRDEELFTRQLSATAELASIRPRSGRWHGLTRRLTGNANTVVGLVILLLIVGAAFAAPLLTPFDPLAAEPRDRLQSPSLTHPFGTDELGRDLWSRVLYGGRLSLRAGFISVGIAVLGGIVVGLVAGYYGHKVDMVLMRLADILMAMPGILLTMVFIFSLGPTLTNAMIAIGLASIPEYARLVRGSVLSAREHLYVDAAHVIGAPPWLVMARHILPNVVAPTLILATIGIGGAILSLAGLSFLGLGAQPPTPEWGVIISDGRARLRNAWWIATFPGLAIALSVLAINLVGDGLRDAFDPRLRRR